MTQLYLSSKSRFCGFGCVCWFHGCRGPTGLPSGSLVTNCSLTLPVVVERRTEQDVDAEVDVDQAGGEQLAVDDHARGHEHLAAPVLHRLVLEIAVVGVLERPPTAEQRAASADLLVAGQRLVPEVEDVVVHRHDLLHELGVAGQPREVVGEQLDRRHRADTAGIERRRVDVAALHQAEHLTRVATDLQRLAVELALERVERGEDVGDRPVAVDRRRGVPR